MIDLYETITNEVIASLEKNVIPWRRPWSISFEGISFNRLTRRPYSILNQILLSQDPGEYATFKGWSIIGGKVKKGAKAKKIFFWRIYERTEINDKGEKVVKKIPVLRYYNVFSIRQVENVYPLKPEEYESEPIEDAERIVNEYITREGINFRAEASNQAYYNPVKDEIVVPKLSQFRDSEEYYSTIFHEMVHSTMRPERCNRENENKAAFFGNEDYSKEELIAELGSAFLCSKSGISNTRTLQNSESYIQSWIGALKNDKHLIVSAASKSEKAVNFILQEDPAET